MDVAHTDAPGHDPHEAVVVVAGEIDLAVRDDLLNTLREAIRRAEVTRVVVDLSGVSFMDSSGLHVLLTARETAHGSGVGFDVVGATGLARRVLEVTGVLQLLTGEPEVDADDESVAPLTPFTGTPQAADRPAARKSW